MNQQTDEPVPIVGNSPAPMSTPSERAAGSRAVTRSASVVGAAVFLSRILGLVREQVFAAFFGAGRAFDAYVIAMRLPSLFRDLLAEGALSAAFVKTFAHTLEREGDARAWRLASLVFSTLALTVGLLVSALMLFAPWVVDAMAHGFDADKRLLTVSLTRVMFPFLFMVALGAVAMGALNAKHVYGVPALASSLFNISSVVVGLLVAFALEPQYMLDTLRAVLAGHAPHAADVAQERAILGMAFGVLVGGVVQFLWQLPALRRQGFRYQPGIDLRDPGLRGVLRLMGPAVLGAAAVQINVFVNSGFASDLGNGAVSWLNYAFRLMQFPIGVFGVAIATATLPAISRATARGDQAQFRSTLAASLRLVLFLTVPSAIGLIALAEPIIALIYQRGNFGAADTRDTAAALACYAGGLVGYSLIKVLAPAFYALDDARTPARISLLSIGVNFAMCSLLVGPFGHRGLALSTAVVATANALLLLWLLRARSGPLGGRELLLFCGRVAVASAALLLLCRLTEAGLRTLSPADPSLPWKALLALLPIAVGAGGFLVACHALRLEEPRQLLGWLRQRRQRRQP